MKSSKKDSDKEKVKEKKIKLDFYLQVLEKV